jgi:bacterioferritin
MSDAKVVIDLLNADMRDEHAAIVQYLQHAYAIGESAEACEIEAVAREEMRHFDWLAEVIVELGGAPALTRGALDLSGQGPVDWMGRDVAAEERAVAQYEAHIAAIDEAEIKRLLQRILSDEREHRSKFVGLGEELLAEGKTAAAPLEARQPAEMPPHVVDILQTGVRHEYTVVLQYLYHSFVMPNCEIGRELEMQAINEMQHLGWLAEKAAEGQAHPEIEHTEMELGGDTAAMLQADIAAERAVTAVYTEQLEQLEQAEEPGLHNLISRIRDHEVYHDELFTGMLAELQDGAPADAPECKPTDMAPAFTVGSLLDQE